MGLKNKETLKNYFKKGGAVSEKHFVDLIDSSMNVIDDGIDVNPKDGLRINPTGIFTTLISFFRKKSQRKADFTVNSNFNNLEGLSINTSSDKSALKIKSDNKVGINTDEPKFDFEVNGVIASKSRIGIFSNGSVPADGVWHKIIQNLDGINAFEVIAHASGSVNSGYYSISRIIALSAFGGRFSKNKIKNFQYSNWDTFLGRLFRTKKLIKFRWTGTLHNYNLEVKTTGDWGINPETTNSYEIKYNVTKLID
jgi:hypothetical protein